MKRLAIMLTIGVLLHAGPAMARSSCGAGYIKALGVNAQTGQSHGVKDNANLYFVLDNSVEQPSSDATFGSPNSSTSINWIIISYTTQNKLGLASDALMQAFISGAPVQVQADDGKCAGTDKSINITICSMASTDYCTLGG